MKESTNGECPKDTTGHPFSTSHFQTLNIYIQMNYIYSLYLQISIKLIIIYLIITFHVYFNETAMQFDHIWSSFKGLKGLPIREQI